MAAAPDGSNYFVGFSSGAILKLCASCTPSAVVAAGSTLAVNALHVSAANVLFYSVCVSSTSSCFLRSVVIAGGASASVSIPTASAGGITYWSANYITVSGSTAYALQRLKIYSGPLSSTGALATSPSSLTLLTTLTSEASSLASDSSYLYVLQAISPYSSAGIYRITIQGVGASTTPVLVVSLASSNIVAPTYATIYTIASSYPVFPSATDGYGVKNSGYGVNNLVYLASTSSLYYLDNTRVLYKLAIGSTSPASTGASFVSTGYSPANAYETFFAVSASTTAGKVNLYSGTQSSARVVREGTA
jgi:hypothetical protein